MHRRRGGMRFLGLAVVLLMTACGASDPSSSPAAPSDPAGSWRLVAGMSDGVALPIPPDHPITLTLEPSRMGGSAACNSYGAGFSLAADGIRMGLIDQTLRGCEEAIQAAETAYLAALGRITRIGTDGEVLVLTGPGVELRFERLSQPPTAELVGTLWLLDTLVMDEAAAAPMGQRATLQLQADGTLSGTTGCRPFDGRWVEQGEQVMATSLAMGDVACPAELASQDSHVVSVIGDGFVPTVEGDRLTLMDPGGQGLVYRSGH